MAFKMLILWTFVLLGRPQDLIQGLGALRPALVAGLITAALAFYRFDTGRLGRIFGTPEAKRYLLLYIIMIIGIPFAYHRRVAFDFVLIYSSNVLFLFVFMALVDSLEKLKTMVYVACVSAFFYSLFGLVKGTFISGRFNIYGEMFDPNDIAYVLVSLLPVSLFFILRDEGRIKKAVAITAMACSLAVILLTGSRAGFIGLSAVFAMVMFSRTAGLGRSYKPVFLIAVLLIAFTYQDEIDVERYKSIREIRTDYNMTDEFGRLEIWKKGLSLLASDPITGVGVDCFPKAIGQLRDRLNLIPRWQAAHNSYLQIAAETGVFGFLTFLALIGASLKNLTALRKNSAPLPEAGKLRDIARFIRMGFIGHLVTAFFLSQGYSVLFTVFFALSASMRLLQPESEVSK